jgi:hypothetical protein
MRAQTWAVKVRGAALAIAAAVLLVSGTAAAFLPTTRALSEAEMAGIVGGNITDECQTTAVVRSGGNGWYCNSQKTYRCNNWCFQCDRTGDTRPCQDRTCWRCGSDDTKKLKECLQYVGKTVDQSCTEQGSDANPPSECPNVIQRMCAPYLLFPCVCPDTGDIPTDQACPRKDCKGPGA